MTLAFYLLSRMDISLGHWQGTTADQMSALNGEENKRISSGIVQGWAGHAERVQDLLQLLLLRKLCFVHGLPFGHPI